MTAPLSDSVTNPIINNQTKRPGRYFRRTQHCENDITMSYGDIMKPKDDRMVRIFFQNVKGLTYTTTGEDYEYYMHNLKNLQVDITGLAETNSPWQLNHIRCEFLNRTRRYSAITKAIFGSANHDVDPIPTNEKFQAGGCLLMIQGKWATSVTQDTITDPTGLGRWAGATILGRNHRAISIISGYRTCKGSIQSAGLGTTFHREYEYHRNNGVRSPNPRRLFLLNLESTIKVLKRKGHAIIMMMDANDVLGKSGDFAEWLSRLDLHDLHKQSPSPSTYIGSNNRRIDYMFGCDQVIAYIQAAGSLSYLDGPQSDHRGLYVDIDLAGYLHYDASRNTLITPRARTLRTGNPELVHAYNQAMLNYYEAHQMESRIELLHSNFNSMPHDKVRQELESWDRDQGRAMKAAEKELHIPRKPYAWSPALRNAGITKRYWKLRLREVKHISEDYSPTIQRLQEQIQQNAPGFKFPYQSQNLDIATIRKHLKKAGQELLKLQKAATEVRFQSYQDLLATYTSDTDPTTKSESNRKARIVKRTIRTERIRSMFRNIRNTIKDTLPNQQTGINKLKVPIINDREEAQNPDEFQAYIANNTANDIVWDTIIDQPTIEKHILQYNRKSFRAAASSPCGHGLIYDSLTFTSLSPEAHQFLSGHIPPEWYGDDELLKEFLMSFMIPPHIIARPQIKTSLSADDIVQGITKWKEATSTSPSGRHLGHYKALIQDPTLLKCMTMFMYVAIKSGTAVSRWSNATNVMLEKDVGNPCIHRLRIIHLFEADFNLYMKMQWGKRLVRRASKHLLLHTGQFGSVPNRTSLEPILLTQLTNDNCRILKKNMARFDNDASACFDRIIVPLAMLAARRCGMSDASVKIHAHTLENMKYTVKTQYGISEGHYTGTKSEPLFGTGQGSGASPAAWLSLVVLIMNTMDKVIKERVSFKSPDSDLHHQRLIDAFVDDTSLSFTTDTNDSIEKLVAELTNIASKWNRLLHYSGGSLNLQKCTYHITMWEWKHGRPHIRKPKPDDPEVCINSFTSGNDEVIRYQDYTSANRILGAYLSPSGDFTTQIEVLTKKADTYAARLRSPKLSPNDIITFLRTTYIPAMGYVLPCLAVNEEELHKVQSKIMAAVMQKLGLSSKTATALRHGPVDMGGLGIHDLRTEMGIAQLKIMRNAIYAGTEVGKMMLLSIKYSQIEAGVPENILEYPHMSIGYMTPTWITSIRQYLYLHNLTLTLSDTLRVRYQGKHDCCIMQIEKLTLYSPQQQRDVNLVRLYLQAITLSDISETNGNVICEQAFNGRRPVEKMQRIHWPRQSQPTQHQIRTWQKYLSENYLRYRRVWNQKLGPIQPNTWQNFEAYQHHQNITMDDPSHRRTNDLKTYIANLPTWHRRLLKQYTQIATDEQVRRAFRYKGRTIDIASDGGLSNGIGTFGWKMVTTCKSTDVVLFQGSGPIDGPSEVGSSTRSELGGFTAPILLAVAIARHWELRHRCKFRWYTDSKTAMSKVRIYTSRRQKVTTKFPEHSDYITTIKEMVKELRRPIALHWVKGHQDDDKEYDKLSRDAKLNVDVDHLATRQYELNRQHPPKRKSEHLPSQIISLTIQGTRFPGNWDVNLRWSINGSYMKQYLMDKHKWKEQVWRTIDFLTLKSQFHTLSPTERTQRFKFMHDLQSTGHNKQKMNSHQNETSLDQCPCCQTNPETQSHLLTCDKNPNRANALNELKTGRSTSVAAHRAVSLMTDCLIQWLSSPTITPTIDAHMTTPSNNPYDQNQLSPHMMEILQSAITEQSQIGWLNMIRGFQSKQWRNLASTHMRDDSVPKQHTDGNQRISTVLQRINSFVKSIWQGRNDALHKSDKADDRLYQSLESAEIRHYFMQPHLLAAQDRHYCTGTLLQLLRHRPSIRRRWLMRVRRARATMICDQHRQARITSFFPRTKTTQTTPHEHTLPTTRRTGVDPQTDFQSNRKRTVQQSNMTHFFPGRPPDSTANVPESTTKSPAAL